MNSSTLAAKTELRLEVALVCSLVPTKRPKALVARRLQYVIWNVWKERNRRIFQHVRNVTCIELTHITHKGIRQRALDFDVPTPGVAPID
jgi:hypothetical protein